MNKEIRLYEINRELEKFRFKTEDGLCFDALEEFRELMEMLDITIDSTNRFSIIFVVEQEKRRLKKEIIQFLTEFKNDLNEYDNFIDNDDLYYNSSYDYESILPHLINMDICKDILEEYVEKINSMCESDYDDEETGESFDVRVNDKLYDCYFECVNRICSL